MRKRDLQHTNPTHPQPILSLTWKGKHTNGKLAVCAFEMKPVKHLK